MQIRQTQERIPAQLSDYGMSTRWQLVVYTGPTFYRNHNRNKPLCKVPNTRYVSQQRMSNSAPPFQHKKFWLGINKTGSKELQALDKHSTRLLAALRIG